MVEREQRQHLKGVVDEVSRWHKRAETAVKKRHPVSSAAKSAAGALLERGVPVSVGETTLWNVLQLTHSDGDYVTSLARGNALPSMPPMAQQAIDQLMTDAARALDDAKPLFGARRMFYGKSRKDAATLAAGYLVSLHDWIVQSGALRDFESVETWKLKSVAKFAASDILDDSVGFTDLAVEGAQILLRHELDMAAGAINAIDGARQRANEFRAAVTTAGNAIRLAETHRIVAEMPVERLKDATSGSLRITALTSAGIKNVQQVLDQGAHILSLPGIGETTGNRMLGAARTIWQTTIDEMPVRIDIKNRSAATTELLNAMRAWDVARSIDNVTSGLAAAEWLRPLLNSLGRKSTHIVVTPEHKSVADLRRAISDVTARAALLTGGEASGDPWDDFIGRPADYFAMLAELGFLADDDEKTQGDLPTEIVHAIRELQLDTTHLKASLRGYQSFGARFAIVQRKVIIGDEMGLGKTIESLAALTHLHAKGANCFLVVCPAAVVTNWVREVSTKSALRAYRIHGPGRDRSLISWIRNGGVAVTTYDSLGWLEGQIPEPANPACLVFDEAHYIKNPAALRTRRSLSLIRGCDRTLLLTGTPLENRIDEFRNLVGYLRPDLAVSAAEFAPRQFRKQVAPAYLRRNQEAVLTELPDLVEVDEWMPLSAHDEQHYRAAVMEGNFMAMRQAALRSGKKSEKMQRLVDIVEEAEANERRVLVFSQSRSVLEDIASIFRARCSAR